MSLEPIKAHNNNDDVDEAEVSKNGNKVNVKLLIRLQRLDIDPKDTPSATLSFNG